MSAVHEWIEKNRKRYKDRDSLIAAGARRFHRKRQLFADVLDGKRASIYTDDLSCKKGGPGSGPRSVTTVARSRKPAGVTVDQLFAAHDADTKVRNAIRKAVATLPEGVVINDSEFRAGYCRVGSQGWKTLSAEPEFKKNRFHIKGDGGGIYWATIATVKDVLDRMPFKAREV
jgi:hypothetical protein